MLLAFLFISLFIMLTIGVPVGFAIGGATIASMLLYTNLDVSMIANYCISGIDSFTMMAIPFFILSGTVMSVGGLARRLIDVAACLVGWITGGLGAVVALSSMFFGAISGSSMATVSSIGSIMVPQMVNKGYDKRATPRSIPHVPAQSVRSSPRAFPSSYMALRPLLLSATCLWQEFSLVFSSA